MENLILQNASLPDNLRKLRNQAGLTQEELVAKMNLLGSVIERTAYSKI